MDLEIVMLSEANQTEKRYRMTSLKCGIKEEMTQMNLQNRKRLRRLPVPTAMFKMGNQQGPTVYSTWNSAQCYVPVWMGQEFGEEWIHVYVLRLSPFTVHLKLSQHC